MPGRLVQYNEVEGSTELSACIECGAGTYSAILGSQSSQDCFNCGKDKNVNATGSDTVTDCIDCDKAQGQVRWIGKERPGIRLHRLWGR
jgi:hypothetical protein